MNDCQSQKSLGFVFPLKTIIVRKMLHDVLNPALQDVAEFVNGIDLDVLILPETAKLGAVDIVVGVKVILGDAPLLHGLPQAVVFYHF